MRVSLVGCGLAASLMLAGTATAADFPSAPSLSSQIYAAVTADTWLVTIRGTVEGAPDYEGSDDYRLFVYPGISVRRTGSTSRFSAPDDGISLSVFDNQMFRFGVTGRLQSNRKDDGQLLGLRKIEWAVEPGLFAEFWPADAFRLRAELRHGFIGHHGFVADFAADYVRPAGAFLFAIGPRLGVGDKDYMDRYFSVTPAEAAANGLVTPFRADGGFRYLGLASSVTYQWSEAWSTTLFGSYNRLLGDAAASPITSQIGSRDQFRIGLTVAYTFGVNL